MNNAPDYRFQRQVEIVHRCGPKPVGELLLEIGRAHGIEDDVAARVERYSRLAPGVVKALDADRFPPPPLVMVRAA